MSFSQSYLDQTSQIANSLDPQIIENIAQELSLLRERNGRLFFVGSGGGAGHSSHAVCEGVYSYIFYGNSTHDAQCLYYQLCSITATCLN